MKRQPQCYPCQAPPCRVSVGWRGHLPQELNASSYTHLADAASSHSKKKYLSRLVDVFLPLTFPAIHLGYVWPFVHTMPTGAHIREINYSRRLNRAIRVNYWPANVHHSLAIFTFISQVSHPSSFFPELSSDWIDAYESVNMTYTVFL